MTDLTIPTDLRILVVDDMSTMRKSIIKSIAQIGILNCQQAGDGLVALEVLNKLHGSSDEINFLMIDINMPNMNGIELLKAVKEDDKFKNIPVMMVSAENAIENMTETKSLGADDFIVKPFEKEELQEHLLRILFPNEKNPLSKI